LGYKNNAESMNSYPPFKTPPTQKEVNQLVKEALDEIQAEKDAGTYIEPVIDLIKLNRKSQTEQ
jgi:hypothetical protein